MGGVHIKAKPRHKCELPVIAGKDDVYWCDCGKHYTCINSLTLRDKGHMPITADWVRRNWPWPRPPRGKKSRAQRYPEIATDAECTRAYIQFLPDSVDRTTELVEDLVLLEWTRDNRLRGIEVRTTDTVIAESPTLYSVDAKLYNGKGNA